MANCSGHTNGFITNFSDNYLSIYEKAIKEYGDGCLQINKGINGYHWALYDRNLGRRDLSAFWKIYDRILAGSNRRA